MNKKDFKAVIAIGVGVGLLVQPIVGNLVSEPSLSLRIIIFFGFTIFAPFALFIGSLIGRVIPALYQFAKFSAVGTLTTFVDLGVLNLEIFFSGRSSGAAFPLFKAASFLASTTNSFFWNKYWTFNAGGTRASSEAVKYYSFATIGLLLNVSAASFVVNFVARPASITPNLWANIGAIFGILGAFLWDFFSYKYLVFKKPPGIQ